MQQAQETVLPPSLRGEYPRQLVRRSEVLPDGEAPYRRCREPRLSLRIQSGWTYAAWRGGLSEERSYAMGKVPTQQVHRALFQERLPVLHAARPRLPMRRLRRQSLSMSRRSPPSAPPAYREVQPPVDAPGDRAMQRPSAAALRRPPRPGTRQAHRAQKQAEQSELPSYADPAFR